MSLELIAHVAPNMESPTAEMFMDDLNSCPEQHKHIAMRAVYCFADNCYRALFPCPSPWVVTEAVHYCATVSAASATNYPTQAIAACGTGKERYISACSCPATNCPIGSTPQATTQQDTAQGVAQNTAQVTAQNTAKITAQPAATSIIEDKNHPQSDPTPIVILSQVPSTAAGGGVAPTHTLNDGAGELDAKSSGESVEIIVTGPSPSESISLYHVSSTRQTENEGKSLDRSQFSSLSPQISQSQPFPTPLGQSSTPLSLPAVFFPGEASNAGSTVSSGMPPTTTTLSPGSTGPTTPANGPKGLSVGIAAAIAVGATLVALLLLGAAAYCCLKRRAVRRGARLRTLTLSQDSMSNQGFDVSSERKPPVELPHKDMISRRVELEESVASRAQLDDDEASSFQATPSPPHSDTSLAPHPSPAELFVLPAELPSVYKT
ncbi:hypothetical protein F4680DRAFT_403613 [Xylaria scruposa]|nr:hypothetical protein F4680DRAFT_403613 [Xylaria scruposa]